MNAAQTIINKKPPSLLKVVELRQARDRIDDQISTMTGTMEAVIQSRTEDLRRQIEEIRSEEEEAISGPLTLLKKERDLVEKVYREGLQACASAGVMEEGRYYLKNVTKADHPINIERFKTAFPGIFEQIATIQKVDAKAYIMANHGVSAKVAEVQLAAVCDTVSRGPPVWDLEVMKRKGEEK